MKMLVVDASVAIKWFVPEIHADDAERLLAEDVILAAPDLIGPEVANAVWKKARRGEITAEHAWRVVSELADSPVRRFSSFTLLPIALDLALSLGRTVYDSLYLALAVVLDTVLVTADRKFAAAVAATPFAAHIRLL
jgi:predicted nucleic acid-binding protein